MDQQAHETPRATGQMVKPLTVADDTGDSVNLSYRPDTRRVLLDAKDAGDGERVNVWLEVDDVARLRVFLDQLEPGYTTVDPEPLAEWERELLDGPQPTVLDEAQSAVYGDRGQDYGHPRIHWTRTACIWTGLLQHKLAEGEHITPEDVGRLYIGDKLARDVNAPKRDNRVDIAGYALCLDRLETGR